MKLRNVLPVLIVVSMLQSCLTEDMNSPQTVFEVADVTVPADSAVSYGTSDGTVTAVIKVRSTETWSADILNEGLSPWIEVATRDFSNPSGADITSELRLVCDYNDEYSPRTAKLRFTTKSGKITDIKVTQKGKTDRVSVDGETSFSLEAETESTVKLKLLSNSSWKAELDSSSTLGVTSIKPAEGTGEGIVEIIPASNYNCNSTSVAVVNLSVPGDTVRVYITRAADIPFMGADPVDIVQYGMPVDTCGTLCFNCNLPWKAEVLENNIKEFKLESLEGEGGMETELPFTMSRNDGDVALTAKVKLALASDPAKNVTLTVIQRAGFILNVDFTEVTDVATCPLQPAEAKYPVIPFTSSGSIDTGSSEYCYKFISDGKEYVFGIKNSSVNVFSHYGSSGTADGYLGLYQGYIKFPAVEGYRLAYVTFTTAATNKKFTITEDAEGKIVVGDEKLAGKEEEVSWDLEDTQYGKSYYEMVLLSKTRQHDIKLLYVK